MLVPEKIEIVDFKIIEGRIDSPYDFDLSKVERHNFDLKFDVTFNPSEKLAKSDFAVNVSTGSEVKASGYFHVSFVFQIENIDELVEIDEENNISVNASLGNAIASITYSTTRGILMTRFQGTGLQHFILPVIDPNELLKNNSLKQSIEN
ncbi:MAG: hypothetical protein ACJAWV_001221 [Flammeovirgaceae bacterium]|jgi:hypothetical protein